MTDKPPITSMDEARAALDVEIESATSSVAYAEREAAEAKAKAEGARSKLYVLTMLRERMEPAQ